MISRKFKNISICFGLFCFKYENLNFYSSMCPIFQLSVFVNRPVFTSSMNLQWQPRTFLLDLFKTILVRHRLPFFLVCVWYMSVTTQFYDSTQLHLYMKCFLHVEHEKVRQGPNDFKWITPGPWPLIPCDTARLRHKSAPFCSS